MKFPKITCAPAEGVELSRPLPPGFLPVRRFPFFLFRLMAFAIIKTGGKQYRVSQGLKFDVEKLDAEVGSSITLDQVLFYGADGENRIGDPVISGVSVTAKVIDQHRAAKVINFKFKRRKGFHKTKGHRRHLTRLEVESINL